MVVCVEGIIGCAVEYRVWYGLWWVWLERCRDGSYAVKALCCDVWVVCTCIAICIVACFIGFWGLVEVHLYMPCFCTFWQSAFSVTCFGAFFGSWQQMCRCKCV